MVNVKQNDIEFKLNSNLSLSQDGKRHSKFGIYENEDFSEVFLTDNGGVLPFVNAVEIDWNSAIIGEG